MGVAGMKRGPRPPILYSFFRELNEEALLKVSLKNLCWFQGYKTLIFKNGPNEVIKVEDKFFFSHFQFVCYRAF